MKTVMEVYFGDVFVATSTSDGKIGNDSMRSNDEYNEMRNPSQSPYNRKEMNGRSGIDCQ